MAADAVSGGVEATPPATCLELASRPQPVNERTAATTKKWFEIFIFISLYAGRVVLDASGANRMPFKPALFSKEDFQEQLL